MYSLEPTPTFPRPVSVLNAEVSPSNALDSSSVSAMPRADGTKQAIVKLDRGVTSGGLNFSHGKHRLIALARTLLRDSSSIDFETDTAIQEALREEIGSNCVFLTIAPRLQTIMDHDRVIVMDASNIAENGVSSDLLANPGGMFCSMCVKAKIVKES